MRYVKTFEDYSMNEASLKNATGAWHTLDNGDLNDPNGQELLDAIDKLNKTDFEDVEIVSGPDDDYTIIKYWNSDDSATLNVSPSSKGGYVASFSTSTPSKDVKEFNSKNVKDLAKKFVDYLNKL